MWIQYRMSDGIWEINTSNLEFFMRSCAHSHAVLKNSTTNTEFNVFMPNLTTVDVDWPSVRKDRDERAEAEMQEFFNRLDISQGGKIVRDNLVSLKAMHDADERAYRAKVKAAQDETVGNISSAVSSGQVAESAAVFVRDLSGTILLSSATVLSGGAILPLVGVLAAGGTIKFLGKYQDTGDFGSAAFTAAAEVSLAYIGVGAQAQGASRFTRGVIAIGGGAAIAGASATIDGKNVAAKTEAKLIGSGVDRLLFRELVDRSFAQSGKGLIISGVISNGSKLIAESVLDRKNASSAIDDAKRAPYIQVSETLLALSPEEQFIENSIMRKVEAHPHCAPIPYL